jgi:hypothetical protein
MAVYQTEIHCNLKAGYFSNITQRVYFIQQYAANVSPDKISERDTHWHRRSYSTHEEMLRGIQDQSLIDEVKDEMAKEATDMFYKGFTVAGFVICVGEQDKGYAVDRFDLEHMNMVCSMPEYALGLESDSAGPGLDR